VAGASLEEEVIQGGVKEDHWVTEVTQSQDHLTNVNLIEVSIKDSAEGLVEDLTGNLKEDLGVKECVAEGLVVFVGIPRLQLMT